MAEKDLTKEREDVCQPIAWKLFAAFAKKTDLPLGEATNEEVIDYYNKMYTEDFMPLVIENDKFKISYLDHLFQLMHLIIDNVQARTEILLNQDYIKAASDTASKLFTVIANRPELPFEAVKESESALNAYTDASQATEVVMRSVPELITRSPSEAFKMMHSAIDDLKIRIAMTLQVRSDQMTNLALDLNDKDDLTVKLLSEKLTALYAKKKAPVDNSIDSKDGSGVK
jgi:hypothetical protein